MRCIAAALAIGLAVDSAEACRFGSCRSCRRNVVVRKVVPQVVRKEVIVREQPTVAINRVNQFFEVAHAAGNYRDLSSLYTNALTSLSATSRIAYEQQSRVSSAEKKEIAEIAAAAAVAAVQSLAGQTGTRSASTSLVTQFCAGCHTGSAVDAKGGGFDLSLATCDDYLEAVARVGLPPELLDGRSSMPKGKNLRPDERQKIVKELLQLGKAAKQQEATPPPAPSHTGVPTHTYNQEGA